MAESGVSFVVIFERIKGRGPLSECLVRVFVGLSMAVCEAKVLRQSVTRWTVGFHLAVLGCQKVKWVQR